ncbi:DUF4296 domain-containing protein [Nonlabens sp. Ci31]|jgi:hypothetical protein|uniref:DUF4296 domain-containing protein n=1 Tax=Nonlabens sp. Ci31 TaxID=2608253 RepID=UPI0014636260|nr:DUF4296 domain-containing protein [Nonlabens sp. Ci31]QJP33508.1 DUF4296 domain-containing protein [Nonlabens sp. Ci31]
MNKIIAVILVLFTISCSDVEKSPEPKIFFSKDKMAALITDLYLVEGAISSNKGAYLKTGIQPSSFLYEKYDMDSITFQENLNYYTDRVEEYLLIMDEVQENFKSLQDSLNARQEIINKEEQRRVSNNTPKDPGKELEKSDPDEEL